MSKPPTRRELSHESSGSFHMLSEKRASTFFWGSPDRRQFGGAEWPKWIPHVEWSQRPVLHFLRTKANDINWAVLLIKFQESVSGRMHSVITFQKGFLDLSTKWNLAHQHPPPSEVLWSYDLLLSSLLADWQLYIILSTNGLSWLPCSQDTSGIRKWLMSNTSADILVGMNTQPGRRMKAAPIHHFNIRRIC